VHRLGVARFIGESIGRASALTIGRAAAYTAADRRGPRRVERLDARLRRQDLRLRMSEAHRRLNAAATRRTSDRRGCELGTGCLRRLPQATAAQPLGVLDRGYAIVESGEGHVGPGASGLWRSYPGGLQGGGHERRSIESTL
jgi:hypothetical protein